MTFNIKFKKPNPKVHPLKKDELFHALINTTKEAVIAISENGYIYLFNPAAEMMFGRKSEDIIGQKIDDLIGKEYLKKNRKLVKSYFSTEILNEGIDRILELPGLRSDGEEFLMEVSLSGGRSDNQKFVVAIARDISDRRRAEMAIKASEERYRSLQENLPLGIYRSTPEGKILTVNPAFVLLLGYSSRLEVLNHSSLELFFNPDKRQKLMKILEKEGAVSDFEVELLKKDGSTLWAALYIKAVKDDSGNILYNDGIVEDISERKQVEKALIESEAKYRILAETAQDVILAHDFDGKIQYINQAGLKSLKYKKDEIEGKYVLDFISSEARGEVLSRQEQRRGGHKGLLLYNIDLIDSEGNHIPFEVSSSVVEEEGKPAMCLVFGRDLSARKRLEYQLYQTQKMDSIGTLAGGIAHDFNNLLTIINGLSEISLRKVESDNDLVRDLRSIHAAGKKAEDLTRKLLAFGRKQIIHPKIIDLNYLISDLDKMLRRLIREDIKIVKDLYTKVLQIKADPGQIEQILMNLVINARDAIGERTDDFEKKIVITTKPVVDDDTISPEHPEAQPDPYILISVSDSGIGMDSATQNKIFEPFFTTKEKGHGTGLGMSTVYGIVKQNNGFITVQSDRSKGSTINIYWPAVDGTLPLEDHFTESLPEDDKFSGTERVLVVEDDPDVLYFACFALKNLGYSVIEAKSGVEALAIIKENYHSITASEKIDLVLTDLIMPGMNGKELSEKISEISTAIKVLFTSGYTEEYIFDKNLISDESNFIQKPFSIRTIAEKVRNMLDTEISV